MNTIELVEKILHEGDKRMSELEKAKKEIERLKQGLEFYANPLSYGFDREIYCIQDRTNELFGLKMDKYSGKLGDIARHILGQGLLKEVERLNK